MLDSLLDAISQFSQAADKFGPRPLRGLLAGRPREGLSFVPFSDSMGLTDPNQVASGRDVTNNLGITSTGDKGWGASALGFGADAVLDPAALLGGAGAAVKGLRGLSHISRPGAPIIHSVASLLGSSSAPGKLAAAASMTPRQLRGGFMHLPAFPGAKQAVNDAADFVGPGYRERGSVDKLTGLLSGANTGINNAWSNNPLKDRIAGEIPPGSEWLSQGGQALLLHAPPTEHAPTGWAVRLSPSVDNLGLQSGSSFMDRTQGMGPIAGRPDLPEVLRPFRSNDFSGQGGMAHHGIRVEHLPLVNPLASQNRALGIQLGAANTRAYGTPLASQIDEMLEHRRNVENIDTGMINHIYDLLTGRSPRGAAPGFWKPFDLNESNVGFMPGQPGRMHVLDGGAIGAEGASVLPFRTPANPGPELIRQILGSGGPQAVRDAMSRAAGSGLTQGVPYPSQLATGAGIVSDPWGARQASLAAIEDFIRRVQAGARPASPTHGSGDSMLRALLGE